MQSGVSFVTIDLSNHSASGTWDTHGDNIPPYGGIWNGLRPLPPVFDHLITTLVSDLEDHSLIIDKERAMRRCPLKILGRRLSELREMKQLSRDGLLMKLGAAREQPPLLWRLAALRVPRADEAVNPETFDRRLRQKKLREERRREGRYLLRTNLTGEDPARLWQYYMQLAQVEEAFKDLKGDLGLRPIYHQREDRVEAHIFVSFLAYCLHTTLRRWLRELAPGLTPRSVFEKVAAMQMIDVHLPITDGRPAGLATRNWRKNCSCSRTS